MRHDLLLISRDTELAARLRRALPLPAARLELSVATADAIWPLRIWRLLLLDAREFPAVSVHPVQDGVPVPVLWLGEPPLLPAGLPPVTSLPGPVVDFLDRSLPASALAFILQQHLAAAYLRARRTAAPPPPAPGQLRAALNNALTGLLGNAQLAADQSAELRRLPPVLVQRLHCIAELADSVRLLVAASSGEHTPASSLR
ncbi:MAG: hypothetical protein ACRD1C_02360 [Terriglobales bacterium]